MPGGDRTGPLGTGPMTGRGLGICAGYGIPGYANPGFGRGFGRGWGRGGFGRGFGPGGGRGWRHQYYATGIPGWGRGYGRYYAYPPEYPFVQGDPVVAGEVQEDELAYLKQQARYFKKTLGDISKRIDELESEAKDREAEEQ